MRDQSGEVLEKNKEVKVVKTRETDFWSPQYAG